MKRKLTDEEKARLAKLKTGYVSMDRYGRLLIIDDTKYFEDCQKRDEAEAAALAADIAWLEEMKRVEAEAGKEPQK